MTSSTIIFSFSRGTKKRIQSANLHVQRYMCFTLFVMTILLMNNKANAQTNPTVIVINASESDIYNSWNTTGLDGICANNLSNIPNVSAARPFTEQLQSLMPSNMVGNNETRRYIGARLYPELTQGWYWPGPNWSQESAALFYTTYNEGGQTVNYSNWAENGLPPAGEAYGTRQAVVWNVTENGWITVDLRTEGEAQVICWLNAVYPAPYAGNETNVTGNETNGTGNETNGTDNETNGTGNETNGTDNETNGTGNETNGTGNESNGTGNETNETGNETNETNNMSNYLVPGSEVITIVVTEAEIQSVFFQGGSNAIQRMLLADEADVNEVFYTEGLDGLCQRNLLNDINVSAVRIYTQEDEEILQQNLSRLNPAQRLYLGAHLYPQFTQGWYWAGPNWSPNGAVLFYTTYNEGGQTVTYSNWAPVDGPPPAGEPYNTRQAVSYNLTQNAWQAVALRTDGQAQVACVSMGSRQTTSTTEPHTSTNDTVIIFVCIFVPLTFILFYIIASALFKLFYLHWKSNFFSRAHNNDH